MIVAQYTISTLSVLKSLSLVKLGKNYDTDFETIDDFVHETCDLLFDNYPLFDEAYRHRLNHKIISHFIFQEINTTPYQRWAYMLNRKMNEIMPYYNQLYESEAIKFNPLGDVDYKEIMDRDLNTEVDTEVKRNQQIGGTRVSDGISDNDTHSSFNTGEKVDVSSETVTLNDETPFNDKEAFNRPSSASKETSKGETDTKGEGSQKDVSKTNYNENVETNENTESTSETDQKSLSKEGIVRTIEGKRGRMSNNMLMKEYRDNMLNIDMMIVDELEDLFMFILN